MQVGHVKSVVIEAIIAGLLLTIPQMKATAQDTAVLFAEGTQALRDGDLVSAEKDFSSVLRLDPSSASAYTNLGVIAMRQKQWADALKALHKAEQLDPSMAGVRLNIGLVYYRMNNFPAAAEALSSLLVKDPGSAQARYLCGLSLFFAERYAESTQMLLPLWSSYSTALSYLYVLGSAAHKANDETVETRAFQQMAAVGHDAAGNISAEFHLYAGKAALTKQDYAAAEVELGEAIQASPTLPMAHFFRAETLSSQAKYAAAKADLLAEIALEPDVAYSYDDLGRVEQRLQHPEEAAQAFRLALAHDPSLATAYVGLAQLDRDARQYDVALVMIDDAERLQPANAGTHYLRGQILARLHRETESKTEFAKTDRLLRAVGDGMKPGAMNGPAAASPAADAQFTQIAAHK